MTIDEAFHIIENLDYPEGLRRKFAQQVSLIQISRDGEIMCVERHKEPPSEAIQRELLNRFPGTFQKGGKPGVYSSCEHFAEQVAKGALVYRQLNPEP